jgi:hypothetical protein
MIAQIDIFGLGACPMHNPSPYLHILPHAKKLFDPCITPYSFFANPEPTPYFPLYSISSNAPF